MRLVLFLIGSLLSVQAKAATSPLLPISSTNTFASGERVMVEAAIQQAQQEGKLVLIDVSAAWCGPCAHLDEDMAANQALLAPTLAHFVMVHVEEMFLEGMAGTDFLPYDIRFFPSIHIYNPTTGKWVLTPAWSSATKLKERLDMVLASDGVAETDRTQLRDKIHSGQTVDQDHITLVILGMMVEESAADVSAMLSEIFAARIASPKQFQFTTDDLEQSLNMAYRIGLENGKFTLASLRAIDPNAFLASDASDNGAYFLEDSFFHASLSRIMRTQGNKAAAEQCNILAQNTASQLKNFPIDSQILITKNNLQCLLLKVQTHQETALDVDAFVANLGTEASRYAGPMMKIYALTGTAFDKALQYGMVEKAEMDQADAKFPAMVDRIDKAYTAVFDAYRSGKTHP